MAKPAKKSKPKASAKTTGGKTTGGKTTGGKTTGGKTKQKSELTEGFCSQCGARMELAWKRGAVIGARCTATNAELGPGAVAGRLGWELTRNYGGEGGMLSLIGNYWCIACGKKLAAKKEASGMFLVSTNCSCGMTWNGHVLGEIERAMAHADRQREERNAQVVLTQKHAEVKKRLARAKGNYLQLARAGDVPALSAISDFEDPERDALSYKWLCVASDFGHAAATEEANDLLENSSLRYDDDQLLVASVHRELAEMYATGTELPRDAEKAKRHDLFAKKLARRN